MKIKNLILLIPFFLMGCQVEKSRSVKVDLPVIDISKQYPKEEICLQDIAESEYIPLETTDDILFSGMATLSAVTDKYILIHEPRRGDIFVFDRTGKLYSHFNHLGQSGQEYSWIKTGTILDENKEEIYVCSQSVQVYSLKGEYRRTLKINTFEYNMKIFNFNDESLLIYEDVIIDSGRENETKKDPYRLVSKKDGSLISVLNIHLPKRYSTRMLKKVDNLEQEIYIYYTENMRYGQDYMIADISSDTLYHLSPDKGLTPLLTRTPSIHASEPRTIWFTELTTDKFVIIGSFPISFSRGGKIPFLKYEFETGKISRVSFLDAEYGMDIWEYGSSSAIAKNMTANLIQATSILKAYEKKQLKGNAEEFIGTLNENDNPVVRVVIFKEEKECGNVPI